VNNTSQTATEIKCFHCGQPCDELVLSRGKSFCCFGCKTVFEILTENELCEYYSFDETPGTSQKHASEESFAYLNEPSVRSEIMEFDSPSFSRVKFTIPAIHCISCIWLLENFQRLQQGVLKSEVNFAARSVTIDFDPASIGPGNVAQRLASLGYAPQITAGNSRQGVGSSNKSLLMKLAVAGFAFGNIMLLSFPEYLGLDDSDKNLRTLFSYLNILLTTPVIGYSARDYFINAYRSFSQRQINIDLPIAAGLLALLSRSLYDILLHTGPGYLDSLTGLVFFLLIGRWFQGKTYETLAFDRDYKAYFPLAVNRRIGSEWAPIVIHELRIGDQIKIRNLEIVPADADLLSAETFIDYSFVTGESRPVKVVTGSLIYAGGRVIGQPIELSVRKKASQGHLTSLWNNPIFQKPREASLNRTIDRAARYFTWVVLGIAVATAIFWNGYDPSRVWLVLTSVLMVACPCALALATPFTYGSLLRSFGRNHLYLKNADVIERMAAIDTIVFDKTGTITHNQNPVIRFDGELEADELSWIKVLSGYSTHPLSNLIFQSIKAHSEFDVTDFREYPGKGIEGILNHHLVKMGSAQFVGSTHKLSPGSTSVFVSIDEETRGYFSIGVSIRENIKPMLFRLDDKVCALLSGDNDSDRLQMESLFGSSVNLLFNQTPLDKLQFVRGLQEKGKRVMMIGDGLNDAGALKQSDVGIAVTDDTSVFTPSCDGILQGDEVQSLDRLLALASSSRNILRAGFALSFFYNAITLSFAVTGHLTPLVAAILMPISSISVVGFASVAVHLTARQKLKNKGHKQWT
jgi:P-type Cu+ transporter